MLSNKFKSRLEEVQQTLPDFQCPFGYTDQYGKRKLRHYSVVEEALKAMKDYCVEKNINIVELFSRFDQDGSMSVTHDEFKEGLRVCHRILVSKLIMHAFRFIKSQKSFTGYNNMVSVRWRFVFITPTNHTHNAIRPNYVKICENSLHNFLGLVVNLSSTVLAVLLPAINTVVSLCRTPKSHWRSCTWTN